MKRFLLALCGFLMTIAGFAQANILNADTPDEIGQQTAAQKEYDNDEPLEYGYVDERDILWAKTTWEVIDLDERVNFPYYYPVDTNNIGSNRRSLYDVLMKNIKNGNIENIYADSYFQQKRTLKDISAALMSVDTTDLGIEQVNLGQEVDEQYIDKREITAADIQEYRIRGYWYFDTRRGELRYRLLGLAPVAPDVNFIDDANPQLVELFWVWFPGARDVLHDAKVFNNSNSSQSFSFDHLLNARRFNAIVYQEDNVQGDRKVNDYIQSNSLMQLLESRRIKEQIRNFELDMWNY